MIQKLQTHLTRFINWLESNPETIGILGILRSNEDMELKRLYKEINHLRDRLRLLVDKLTNDSSAYNRLVNQSYSHIKRKEKSLKIPKDMFVGQSEESKEDRELRIATIQEIIIVATSLKGLFKKTKKYSEINKAEQMAMNNKSELLCDMILASFRDVATSEGIIMAKKGKI